MSHIYRKHCEVRLLWFLNITTCKEHNIQHLNDLCKSWEYTVQIGKMKHSKPWSKKLLSEKRLYWTYSPIQTHPRSWWQCQGNIFILFFSFTNILFLLGEHLHFEEFIVQALMPIVLYISPYFQVWFQNVSCKLSFGNFLSVLNFLYLWS